MKNPPLESSRDDVGVKKKMCRIRLLVYVITPLKAISSIRYGMLECAGESVRGGEVKCEEHTQPSLDWARHSSSRWNLHDGCKVANQLTVII